MSNDNNQVPPPPEVEAKVFSFAAAREKKKLTAPEGVNLEEANKDNYLRTQEAARRRRADANSKLRRDLKNGGGGKRW